MFQQWNEILNREGTCIFLDISTVDRSQKYWIGTQNLPIRSQTWHPHNYTTYLPKRQIFEPCFIESEVSNNMFQQILVISFDKFYDMEHLWYIQYLPIFQLSALNILLFYLSSVSIHIPLYCIAEYYDQGHLISVILIKDI